MSISLNKKFNGIKTSIEKQINSKTSPVILNLEFNENVNSRKEKFDLHYLKKFMSTISKMYPNTNFSYEITYVKHDDFHIDNNQCKKLEEINNYLIDNFNSELLVRKQNELSRSFTFQSVINANRELDKIIEKVNNAKKTHPNISTFEKFMLLYEEVTDFIYKEEARYDQLNASHWISVVNGDSIVCTGYASLMQELSKRIFSEKDVLVIENDVDVFDKSRDNLISAHANNAVFIKDDKYNINGFFYLDPCWDSIETKDEIKAYSYCCIPLKDIDNHKFFSFYFRNVYQYNLEDSYTKFFSKSKNIMRKIPLFKNISADTYFEDKNSLHYYINNYETLENQSYVPLNAYLNAFKIIGEEKGLKDDELKSFVKDRMEKSFAKTKYYFNIDKCNNAFAKELVKEKEKSNIKR